MTFGRIDHIQYMTQITKSVIVQILATAANNTFLITIENIYLKSIVGIPEYNIVLLYEVIKWQLPGTSRYDVTMILRCR